jgi:hypothetical protein
VAAAAAAAGASASSSSSSTNTSTRGPAPPPPTSHSRARSRPPDLTLDDNEDERFARLQPSVHSHGSAASTTTTTAAQGIVHMPLPPLPPVPVLAAPWLLYRVRGEAPASVDVRPLRLDAFHGTRNMPKCVYIRKHARMYVCVCVRVCVIRGETAVAYACFHALSLYLLSLCAARSCVGGCRCQYGACTAVRGALAAIKAGR